jgi:hypothetical protein
MIRLLLSHPLATQMGIDLSDRAEAEALADSVKAQFHPPYEPFVPAVNLMVANTMPAYTFVYGRQLKLTSSSDGRNNIRGPKVCNVSGQEVS